MGFSIGAHLDAYFPSTRISATTTALVTAATTFVSYQVADKLLGKAVIWQPLALATFAATVINRIFHRNLETSQRVLEYIGTVTAGGVAAYYLPRAFNYTPDIATTAVAAGVVTAAAFLLNNIRLPNMKLAGSLEITKDHIHWEDDIVVSKANP